MKRIIFILCIHLITFTPGVLSTAPESLAKYYITGKVYRASNNRPVSSVWVVVLKNDKTQGRSLTGDRGRYFIGGLAKGRYTIQVRQGKKILYTGSIVLRTNKYYDIRIP